ncbi:hypothetical protein RUND412_002114 [Rhizina undulata]
MLLLRTTETTKIGDIHRYTITYTPSHDRILPAPTALHLRVRNTASLPLRAAYLHGPYTLYVSVRRQEFQPWTSSTPGTEEREEELAEEVDRNSKGKKEDPENLVPIYDPHLKAGASFYATLPIPTELIDDVMDNVRREGETKNRPLSPTSPTSPSARRAYEHGGHRSLDNTRTFFDDPNKRKSVTWIVEVVSQVIFSTSASVGFELLLGRDKKSLNFVYAFNSGNGRPDTAMSDGQAEMGVLSSSLKVKVQGTKELWNLPPFPTWEDATAERGKNAEYPDPDEVDDDRERGRKIKKKRKPKKVHLVILTHGLHSNSGADMLFMKETIDEEARKGDLAWRVKRDRDRKTGKQPEGKEEEKEEDREQVIVRAFHGNVCRTERGIKYLGKRLARYVLNLTHPTDEHARYGKSKLQKHKKPHHHPHLTPAAAQSPDEPEDDEVPPYKITSISFIGHSLGGLVQTYAIAYIHAHSPNFFYEIKPINFVALATPFLGLSNENPLYVKFALDFGLVGRTGQDLGLTWRAPNAFSFSPLAAQKKNADNTSKPLLRILPTGPAHDVLKMFRNRTVYANVVNDGIVPLRTSCMLFLDWKGLGRVEKARRENGAVGGLVEWGWGQLVTSNSPRAPSPSPTTGPLASPVTASFWARGWDSKGKMNGNGESSLATGSDDSDGTVTPLPDGQAKNSGKGKSPEQVLDEVNPVVEAPMMHEQPSNETLRQSHQPQQLNAEEGSSAKSPGSLLPNSISSLMTIFRLQAGGKKKDSKAPRIYRRSQTINGQHGKTSSEDNSVPNTPVFGSVTNGVGDVDDSLLAPPKTSILEAAGDVLNPPLPTTEFIMNPSKRPQAIFHDRVYHSDDIPPVPLKARRGSTLLSLATTSSSATPSGTSDQAMKVEEKIARAYHEDISWRKVLVRLEPDAHNNMIVRRMFANAYGWPVVQHVVETHFGESYAAKTPDSEEGRKDRPSTPVGLGLGLVGKAIEDTLDADEAGRNFNRQRRMTASTEDSGVWDDKAFEVTDDDTSEEDAYAREYGHPNHHPGNRGTREDLINGFLGIPPSPSLVSSSGASTAATSVPNTPYSSSSASGENLRAQMQSSHHRHKSASAAAELAKVQVLGLSSAGTKSEGVGRGEAVRVGLSRPSSDAVRLLERSISKGERLNREGVEREEGVVERVARLSYG